jgi:hypothetical protein
MTRYTEYKPKTIPVFGLGDARSVARVQSIDKTGTINKTKVEELGRDGVVEYVDQAPAVTYKLNQLEHGNIDYFRALANKSDAVDTIVLNDFGSSAFDMVSYVDDSGTFKGSLWIPKLRLSGFTINIGSPKDLITRAFDFVGEDWIQWQGDNKYLIYKEEVAESGTFEITVEDPEAVKDPNSESGEDNYILRVVRVRDAVGTELVEDNESAPADNTWSYDTGTLTVLDCEAGDTIKYWYTAGVYITAEEPFELNDDDLPAIHANSASIYLETGNYIYRLQSVSIAVALDREDVGEIGNDEVVQRSIKAKTVTITLGQLLNSPYTMEEILAGKTEDYGKLDIRKFSDKFVLRVKLFSNKGKGTFKIGFKCIDLAPTEVSQGASVGTNVKKGNTLVGQDCIISIDSTIIDA